MSRSGPRMKGIGQFGQWIASNLIELDMTMQEFADKIKVPRASINAHTREMSKPSYLEVAGYCYIFGGRPSAIWELVEEEWKGVKGRGKSSLWFSSKEG